MFLFGFLAFRIERTSFSQLAHYNKKITTKFVNERVNYQSGKFMTFSIERIQREEKVEEKRFFLSN